jgi:hypothetical protein
MDNEDYRPNTTIMVELKSPNPKLIFKKIQNTLDES